LLSSFLLSSESGDLGLHDVDVLGQAILGSFGICIGLVPEEAE
jgi:hypothetical protein